MDSIKKYIAEAAILMALLGSNVALDSNGLFEASMRKSLIAESILIFAFVIAYWVSRIGCPTAMSRAC